MTQHFDTGAPKRNNTASLDELWSAGSIEFGIEIERDGAQSWSVAVCGDWAPQPGRHQRAIASDPIGYYGNVLPKLRCADLALVNLECPILERPAHRIVKDGDAMFAPPSTIGGLTAVPFAVACLANNHILDFGETGLRQTMTLLRQHGVATVGAGLRSDDAERPVILPVGGIQLAILNVAEGEEARASGGEAGAASLDLERLRDQIRCVRPRADVIMVVVHAGREYLPVPAPHIRDCYRALVEAGADLVVGHHPHVPQGIELHDGKPIVYSLGNFAFDMETSPVLHRRGYVFIAHHRGRSLSRIDIHPYEVHEDGLRLLSDASRSHFLSRLGMLSGIAADTERLEHVWGAYADRWLMTRGIPEALESLTSMAGYGSLVRARLAQTATRFEGAGFTRRLARRALWSIIAWADRRAQQSSFQPISAKAAATLRNRFDTASHCELYLTALRRVMDGQYGRAAEPDYALLDELEVFW